VPAETKCQGHLGIGDRGGGLPRGRTSELRRMCRGGCQLSRCWRFSQNTPSLVHNRTTVNPRSNALELGRSLVAGAPRAIEGTYSIGWSGRVEAPAWPPSALPTRDCCRGGHQTRDVTRSARSQDLKQRPYGTEQAYTRNGKR
jgi:hypothetical protein